MPGEPITTIVGNLVADPELNFTQSGKARVSFKVAATPRIYDRNAGQWKEGEALFMRCNAWERMAENIAQSLTKGMRVVVHGRLTQRSFETREGEKRTVLELQVEEVGPSLRYATARVERQTRENSGNYGGNYGAQTNGGWGDNAGSFGGQTQSPFSNGNGYGANAGTNNGQADYPWGNDASQDEPPF